MYLVDSHCHLQADRFARDVGAVIDTARAAGVERILVPGWNVESSREALDLVSRFPWLDSAVGVHPHDASAVDAAGWREIESLASDPWVVAIGETGLDFDRAFSPRASQIENLRRNLALALATGKPAILHCRSRSGERDAQDVLRAELQHAGAGSEAWLAAFGARPGAVIHSFSGPEDYARDMLALGVAVSFSGLVFRRGEEPSASVAAMTPTERLLVETDAPYLTPPGGPRQRNEPAWVRVTAAWLADQRGMAPEDLGDALVANYAAVFSAR